MGIFAAEAKIWTYYRATIQYRDRVMGGTPRSPKMLEGWLRAKAGITDDEQELQQAMLRTLRELGADVTPDMSYDQLVEASESVAAQQSTNGFKRDADGLYLEGRCLKAMLKENTNIAYADQRWGPTKKGPKSFLSERVFVMEDRIHLGRQEPDGVELFIGHTQGPKGAQSNLTYYEYCVRPQITFHLMVWRDVLTRDQWATIFTTAEENGSMTLRSQGYGRFDVVAWEKLDGPPVVIGLDAAITVNRTQEERDAHPDLVLADVK